MNEVFIAYMDFWSSFIDTSTNRPIPAFPEGGVVTAQGGRSIAPPFPYIVYPVLIPNLFTDAIATASIWDSWPQNPGFTGRVRDVLGQMMKRMPPGGGEILRLNNGAIRLYSQNMSIMGDPDDRAITRGVFNFLIRSNYGGV